MTIVAGVVALQAAYLLCTGRFRDRIPGASPVPQHKQLLFTAGILILALALLSPLDDLADHYLFSAHMVQHLLLTLAVAPLLLAGTPGWLLRATRTGPLLKRLRHPLVAFPLFNGVFALAHLTGFYEAALAIEPLHALEHLLFLATAVIMWLPVLSPLEEAPPYPPLGQVLYLFLQTVPASLLGALLTHATSPFYATYELAPRIVPGLSALEDQQLGGLIMWVGSGLYFLIATACVFFAWAAREETASRRPVGAT